MYIKHSVSEKAALPRLALPGFLESFWIDMPAGSPPNLRIVIYNLSTNDKWKVPRAINL